MNGSGDISGIISKLTENPELMKNLMGIADGLMKGDGGAARRDVPVEAESNDLGHSGGIGREKHQARESGGGDYSEKQPKHNGFRGDDAENLIRLLIALKPYVGKERCTKIDSIVKILKLIRLSEQSGLLGSLL